MYLDTNKKRVRDWFQTSDTHLPLGGTKFGLIRSIPRANNNVKYSTRTTQTGIETMSVKQLDGAYMEVYNSGDEQRMQELVDEVARRAGYSVETVYHGTQRFGFTKFDPRKTQYGTLYTTNDYFAAESYTGSGRMGSRVRPAGDYNLTNNWIIKVTPQQLVDEMRKLNIPGISNNTRIVAITQEEFIRGLKDTTVDVVTGYHGNIREWERIDSETGRAVVNVEPLGDAGMPVFAYDAATGEWTTEYEGKTTTHKALAKAIAAEGLQYEYYVKTCCITGRCAKCNGKCGAMAKPFNMKNATNRDAESVAYWQREMEYDEAGEVTIEHDDVQYSPRKTVDNADDDDYNTSGMQWVYDASILTKRDQAQFHEAIVGISHRRIESYPLLKDGDYAVWTDRAIIFTNGNAKNPTISAVMICNTVDPAETVTEIRRRLYGEEGKWNGDIDKDISWKVINSVFRNGEVELFRRTLRDTYGGYEYRRSGEGGEETSYRVGDEVDTQFSTRGQTDTPEFKEWFGDSKVVNEDGTPKLMYHGTPYGGYTVFKDWQYFTEDKKYADVYQEPSASSIRGRYNPATNPMTYAAYLSVKKPFDTRDPKMRRIWQDEFYGSYSRTPLSDKGLPDWTDGIDLVEWIEENDYDYDAIILDEGGTGGYGDDVNSRGSAHYSNIVDYGGEPRTGKYDPLEVRKTEYKGNVKYMFFLQLESIC